MQTVQPLEAGIVLGDGRYRLMSRVGRGSMAEVWLARDEKIGRPVAVKVVAELLAPSEQARRRFAVEVRAVGRVHHPNVVSMLGHGTLEDGRPFLVMEHVAGETLQAYFTRKGPIGAYSTAMVARQVLAGLAAAHAQNIIHRDLKPANIIIADLPSGHRRVKIVDFGVARVLENSVDQVRLTQTGTMLGSPKYMCLEVARGAPDVDQRADIFALGAVMYDALAGRPPFVGKAIGEVVKRILSHDIEPLAGLRPDVPHELVAVIERAMAHDASDRFADASCMRQALDAATEVLRR